MFSRSILPALIFFPAATFLHAADRETLQVSAHHVSLSSVGNEKPAIREIVVTNSGDEASAITLDLGGESLGDFRIPNPPSEKLPPGASATLAIEFGGRLPKGCYGAELRIDDGVGSVSVALRGLRTEALEGGNEPPLALILEALGSSADVGGDGLDHDTKSATLGSSIPGGWFRALGDVKVTPLARYSPPGKVPFGIRTRSGKSIQLDVLADSATQTDAHQCLLPPMESGRSAVSFAAPDEPFAVFAQSKGMLCTAPGRSRDASVAVPARVWPVGEFQGRTVDHAFLIGFEEATNGDYQDALFLIENVEPVTAGS